MLCVPLAVLMLVAVIRFVEKPAEDGISRAAACKAAALFLTTAEDCRGEAETERSLFAASDRRQWYVKYMDWLYRENVISEEMFLPAARAAEAQLTYGEAVEMAGRLAEIAAGKETDVLGGEGEERNPEETGRRLAETAGMTEKNRKKPIPEGRFWQLYDELCEIAGDGSGVKEIVLQIVGTPDNVEDAPAWTAYTDQGLYGFEGLGLSRYADCRIRVLVKDHEMIHITEIVSEEVACRNVWIVHASEGEITGFTGDCTRTFRVEKGLKESESLENQLADLWLSGGSVERIAVKRERITARVLSVRDDVIELEGYGDVGLDEDFCVYKVYGEFERQDLSQILVGYDTQEFIVADGKLCAALIVRSFGAETIRVLISDTGFHSIYHSEIRLEFLSDCVMRQDGKETVFCAGQSVTVAFPGEHADDSMITLAPSDPRLVFLPADERTGIRVAGVIRGQGAPVCPGRLEISCETDGLILVNELYMEDYLKRVLPSEMPLSYEPEALKAQAVCARTYAYRQIRGNSCRSYGAHVDDSTNYQVYNNSETGREAETAVDATYGQILMYGDDAAETYYFSTSCGHTTDMGAWGQEPERTPYLHAVEVRPDGGIIETGKMAGAAGGPSEVSEAVSETSGEEAFAAFIRGDGENVGQADFEASCSMYRWQTRITASQLQENIPDIGRITDMRITGRGAGGVARRVTVIGSDGTKEIEGESRIRAALGHPGSVITKNGGGTLSGWGSLPSAFISIEEKKAEDGERCWLIYGGGYGHGIGMSQNGAQAMAKRGWKYGDILDFFYEGTRMETVY